MSVLTRGGAVAARRVHTPKVAGSSPAPATLRHAKWAYLCSLIYQSGCLVDHTVNPHHKYALPLSALILTLITFTPGLWRKLMEDRARAEAREKQRKIGAMQSKQEESYIDNLNNPNTNASENPTAQSPSQCRRRRRSARRRLLGQSPGVVVHKRLPADQNQGRMAPAQRDKRGLRSRP